MTLNHLLINFVLFIRIIDWDFAFAHPLQKCAVFPKLLENIPGAAPPDLPESLAYINFRVDKAYLLSVLAEKERQRGNRTGRTTDFTKLIETSSERNFFEQSHHIVTTHREFASRFCERSHDNVVSALKQINSFVAKNPEFSHHDGALVDVVMYLEDLLEKTG